MDGELEQGGHKEAFPAAETAKWPINQSWRFGSNVDSGPRTALGRRLPGPQLALFPVHQLLSTALHLSVQGVLTRSCTETLEIINIYSKLPSCSHCRWEDNSGRAPRERKKGGFFHPAFYVLTNTSSLYGAEISKVCDSKGEGQFWLHLSNPMNVPLVLEL